MRSTSRCLLWLLTGLCFFSSVLYAEPVAAVENDGTLTLESGKKIFLVGLRMDSEGISVLRVLAQKQDLRLELIANPKPGAPEAAYAYLQAKYLKFPVKPNGIPDEEEVLLNEFLVKTGAAKVAEDQDFGRKPNFLKIQEEAKAKGEGVWSYEVS
ncbi:MAG: thermonuclease family protein [Candidatus Omnitrophota bacterium]